MQQISLKDIYSVSSYKREYDMIEYAKRYLMRSVSHISISSDNYGAWSTRLEDLLSEIQHVIDNY